MESNNELIGSKIRHYREAKGFSQEELADIVDATERHLRNVEYGQKGLSVHMLISLANALDITPDILLSDYLTGSNDTQNTELIALLNDCNPTERALLMDMLKHMKALLLEHGI